MDNNRYCLAWLEDGPRPPGKTRAALWRETKWPDQFAISVSFLDGPTKLHDRVEAAAQMWTKHTNLSLVFRDDTTRTHVRIAFERGAGSWSRVGTSCKRVPKTKATMNFGWLTINSGEQELEGVVLHEFGHALGLVHEHQSPAGGIKWDKPVVYAELKRTHGWSKEKVDRNVLEPEAKKETNFTKFDPLSIMLYPVPAHWTTDRFSTSTNTKLSKVNRKFIASEYP